MSIITTTANEVKTFKPLGVAPWLIKNCSEMSIVKPTAIQVESIPWILKGRDVIGQAKTGCGKTAAFALPMLQALARDPFGVFGIVLTPTRELALQMTEQFEAFGVTMNLKLCVVIGGTDIMYQQLALLKQPHIIIATPGRLASHITNGVNVALDHVEFLVLDEADRLFEDCFEKNLKTIMDAIPPPDERQTLLFSATMPDAFLEKAESVCNSETSPIYCRIKDDSSVLVETLDQRYIFTPQTIKACHLVNILKNVYPEEVIIIFCGTCREVQETSEMLLELEIDNVTLHSHVNQARRTASLGKFRAGLSRILIATDVASRGLDIPSVRIVINYDIPNVIEDYIHRAGRTARAGKMGQCITIVTQYDIDLVHKIEERVGRPMKELETIEKDVHELIKSVNGAKRLAKLRLERYEMIEEEKTGARKRKRNEK